MKQREQWRPVLEAEMKRWSAMSCAQLASQLVDVRTYEVEFESEKYQVEVQILENTDSYVHVGVAANLLEARVIVTSYNQHVRLLSPEPWLVAPPKSTRAWEPTLLWNHCTQNPLAMALVLNSPRAWRVQYRSFIHLKQHPRL
jgi:hypothetical protein